MTRKVTDRVTLTRFESMGSLNPLVSHLAGWATFSDGRRLHVYGTVGTTAWQYIPAGKHTVANARRLSGPRMHLLNEGLKPFLAYELALHQARAAAEVAGQAFNLAVTNAALRRKDAAERLLENGPALVKRLGEAAASAAAAHHERLSDELVAVAEVIAGFNYAAVSGIEAMNTAEAAFTAARIACDAIDPPAPEIPKESP